MEYLIHVANVFFLASYAVRDILWLRLLTLVGLLAAASYDFHGGASVAPLFWYAVLAGLNLYHVVRLIQERRPVLLLDEDQELYELVFSSLTPRQYLDLIALADHQVALPGDRMVWQGQHLERLMLVRSGRAVVGTATTIVSDLRPGSFIGEMSYLTGEPTSAGVIALEQTGYLCWHADQLQKALEDKPKLRAAIQGILGVDLAHKLRDRATSNVEQVA
ncbi:MAG: cyclic nucleotide-binding domain-containing protein [Proteobacteria bacterium]|nr:cyclic nucleotide-binding domain-containing protein [Pseudomonadota bacterium]